MAPDALAPLDAKPTESVLLILQDKGSLFTKISLYQHGLLLMPGWISNYNHYNLWDEIIYPFPNFNGATVEFWEWVSNFISYFTKYVITYTCWVWS